MIGGAERAAVAGRADPPVPGEVVPQRGGAAELAAEHPTAVDVWREVRRPAPLLLGTLLGLFETVHGASLALTSSADVDTLRRSLTTPIEGRIMI